MASYSKFERDNVKNANNKDMFKRPMNRIKQKTRSEQFEDQVIDWVTFYRRNIHRFVEHYLGFNMHLYQTIILYLMNLCPLVVIVACRASAKSYMIAIFACAKCILYPNSKVVIASATKKQSALIVSEKIKKELMPNSPNLSREIKEIRTGANETEVFFYNGSSIIVVPATDNARGVRATVLIYEEFRMIKKEIIDSVLAPFLIIRPVPYLNNPEYEHLQEEPQEIYISSSWFKSLSWFFDLIKIATVGMYKTKDSFIIGMDYSITLRHNIRTKKQLIKEKKKMDGVTFDMEYNNYLIGGASDAYYTFEMLNKNQKLKKVFYPRKHIDVIEDRKNKWDIAKQKGEIRVVSVDIAMIVNKKGQNDNTVITCIRALPSKEYYERQVSYIEGFNGGNTGVQSKRIKQIFFDFKADYLVIDVRNAGVSILDELGKVTYDDERDCEYPALGCFNNDNLLERIDNPNALKVVYGISADADFNHRMHMKMKDVLERERLKLIINSTEAKDYLEEKKDYNSANSIDKVEFEKPYLQSELLINETINLSYELKNNKIKLSEPRSGTKDRYISLAYGNYFISELELKLHKEEIVDWGSLPSLVSSVRF